MKPDVEMLIEPDRDRNEDPGPPIPPPGPTGLRRRGNLSPKKRVNSRDATGRSRSDASGMPIEW